jgi:hypothetical protein
MASNWRKSSCLSKAIAEIKDDEFARGSSVRTIAFCADRRLECCRIPDRDLSPCRRRWAAEAFGGFDCLKAQKNISPDAMKATNALDA